MIQGRINKEGIGYASLQGVYLNVSLADWSLFKELVRKFFKERDEGAADRAFP